MRVDEHNLYYYQSSVTELLITRRSTFLAVEKARPRAEALSTAKNVELRGF